MKIISFAWTTEALLQGKKTQTRRFWKDSYAKQFKKGEMVQAYDKNPRAGGKIVAFIRLTKDPYQQHLSDMTVENFEAEGGTMYWSCLFDFQFAMKQQKKGLKPWVLEFELLRVVNQ